MKLGIPDKLRKPVYWLLIVIGAVMVVAGRLDPALAASANDAINQITQTLTALFGLVTAYGGVAALIHFTPSGSAQQNAPPPDTSSTPGTGSSATSDVAQS